MMNLKPIYSTVSYCMFTPSTLIFVNVFNFCKCVDSSSAFLGITYIKRHSN